MNGIYVGVRLTGRMMQEENIWKLLARKMNGEATEAELDELRQILKNDPVMNYTAETFMRLWNTPTRSADESNESGQENVQRD
jgi:transmembrane sensor